MIVDYLLRLVPGLAVLGATFAVLGRTSAPLRVTVLVLGFVLVRDLMTPLGLWSLGRAGNGAVWLRFVDDPLVLTGIGIAGAVTAVVVGRDRDVVWGRPRPRDLALALALAAVIVAPVLLWLRAVPLAERGGPVPVGLLVPVVVLALGGNLLEEVLFRGLVQGRLTTTPGWGPVRVVVASGLFFAAGHVFLATTVTDLGAPVLVFTLVEGLACAYLRHRSGVLAAALLHGAVIFALASGL